MLPNTIKNMFNNVLLYSHQVVTLTVHKINHTLMRTLCVVWRHVIAMTNMVTTISMEIQCQDPPDVQFGKIASTGYRCIYNIVGTT